MKYIIIYGSIVLISIITLSLITYVMKMAKEQTVEMTKDIIEIRLPRGLSILFFSASALFGILSVLIATVWNNETVTLFTFLIFGGFTLVPLIIGINILRHKVNILGETIKVYPMIGKPKDYQFSQITHVIYHIKENRMENMVKVYAGKKKLFTFSEMYTGFEYMYQRLKEAGLL